MTKRQKKTERLDVRLETTVNNMLIEGKKKANISKTEYITQLIVNGEVSVQNSKTSPVLEFHYKKIGNNLNQIAYVLNIANKSNTLNETIYEEILNQLLIISHNLMELKNA